MSVTDEKKYVLGCDIGNGYGYVSVLLDPNTDPRPLFSKAYGLADFGMPTTAYVVPQKGEEIKVFENGKSAESKYIRKTEQLIRAVKTRLKEGTIAIPGIQNLVEVSEIYSAIVRDLLILAEEELSHLSVKPIYDVVFTFPASFSDDVTLLETMQRSIEKLAINGEQVHVLGRLPEPAAVAIDYLHYMQHIAPEEVRITKNEFTVLVYDLGHGTFDTAVVTAQSQGTPYKLHLKDGLPEVGGKNFDEILYNEILSELQKQYGFIPQNENQRARIRREAVDAKIALTEKFSYIASIMHQDMYYDVNITRARFEELSEYLILQTLELSQNLLDEAAANGIQIDCIVLSGGASQMPMVKKNLEQLIEGKYPIVLHRPGQAVSFGAARFAYGISEEMKECKLIAANNPIPVPFSKIEISAVNTVMEQLTDCCYGIWLPAEGKLEGEIRFLIPSGVTRPAVSQTVSFFSESSRVIVKLFRSKEKNKVMESASLEECESILWVPFDVEPGAQCKISITVLENYGIQIDFHSDQGEHYRKTTSDVLTNLV